MDNCTLVNIRKIRKMVMEYSNSKMVDCILGIGGAEKAMDWAPIIKLGVNRNVDSGKMASKFNGWMKIKSMKLKMAK